MKKLLSVLLSVAMIIGCLSVCFTSFAEVDEELIAKFNDATKRAASEYQNEDGTTNYSAGYTFEQVIASNAGTFSGDEMQNALTILFQDKYPEFTDYEDKDNNPNDCFIEVNMGDDDNPIYVKTPNGPAIARIASGVEEYGSTKVNKFSNGSDTLGDYALKATEITADMLDDIEDEGAGAYTYHFKDVVISDDELVSESGIAAVMNKYPDFDGMDDRIIDEAKTRGTGITFKTFELKLTNIGMRVVYSGDNIQSFVLSYRLQADVTFRFSGENISFTGFVDVKSSYTEFEYYDEASGEMNLSELVQRINEATAYAVDSKAGYDFSRTAQYPMGATDYAHFTLNLTEDSIEENLPQDSIVAGLLSGLPLDEFLNNPANINLTRILIALDLTEGIQLEGMGTWVCNCADCDKCEEDSCDADNPCTCPWCNCHAEIVDVPDLLEQGITAISEKLQDTVRSGVQSAFDFGAEGATVPAGKDGKAILNERAFKATNLNVNDISMAMTNPDGSIMFMLPTQVNPDENSALAHLTDDYASAGEIMDAWKVGFLNTFGVDPFSPNDDGTNSGVTYDNIMVTVKFEEADEENPYGNGKIESMSTFYYCMTSINVAAGIITGDFGVQVSDDYDNFKYKDYEKGDADVSGRVSIIDAKLVLKHIVGTETLSGLGFTLADMNDDGELKVADAKAILQKVADDAAAAASGGSDTSTGDTGSDTGDTTNG